MNREQVRSALAAFIATPELRVAALAGGWGVGKTYLWSKFADSLTLPETLNGVAYASLFGASSLAELRLRVAEGLVLARTRESLVGRYEKQAGSRLIPPLLPIAQGAPKHLPKLLGFARRWIDNGFGGLIADSGYWFVRDSLVALDDLERCPIEPVTLMGFVDELRGRGCKVVLITNRDRLDKKKHGAYWEKVVDCDIKLSPDADENSRIVFGDDFRPIEYAQRARATLRALNCDNIRIHKRVAGLIREITPKLGRLAQDVQAQVVVNATVLCWVILEPTARIPLRIVVMPKHSRTWASLTDDDKLSEEEKRWRSIAEATDFSPLDFDEHLVSLVSAGWCDGAALESALQQVNAEVNQHRASRRLQNVAYATYTDSFNLSREAYIEKVRTVLHEEIDHLFVHQFGDVLAHLQSRLGLNTTDLAHLFIERRGSHLDAVAQAHDRQEVPEKMLEAEVARREKEFLASRYTIESVAQHLVTSDGWSSEQIKFLANQSVDEYEAWILSQPPSLGRKLKLLLGYRTSRLGEPYPTVARHVADALGRIAEKGEFNRERIREIYGIEEAAPAMHAAANVPGPTPGGGGA